eukprot:scaffold16122_cov74-Phaeocystis_antarctica.AAC.2
MILNDQQLAGDDVSRLSTARESVLLAIRSIWIDAKLRANADAWALPTSLSGASMPLPCSRLCALLKKLA